MDIADYAALKFPSLDVTRERIWKTPVELFEYIPNLQKALYNGWNNDHDYRMAFQNFEMDPFFEYLFKNKDLLGKLKSLVGLPKDVEFLTQLEAQLVAFLKQNPPPRKGFRRAKTQIQKPLSKYERFRVEVGSFGLRQIAIELKKFLKTGDIQLDDDDLKEMQEIFLGGDIREQKEASLIKGLIYGEFKHRWTRKDWQEKFTKTKDPVVKNWATLRMSGMEHPKLIKAYSRVRKLEALARKQPLRTDQEWDLQYILDGTSDRVKWWRGDLWKRAIERNAPFLQCKLCDAQATHRCVDCGQAYCEIHS